MKEKIDQQEPYGELSMDPNGHGEVTLYYPKIGTCGDAVNMLRLHFVRVRYIPDLVVGFDGERNGWTIGGYRITGDGDNDCNFKELAFIQEEQLDGLDEREKLD